MYPYISYCICIHLNILLKQVICEDEPPLRSNEDICENRDFFGSLFNFGCDRALSSFCFVLFMLHPPHQFNLLCTASSNMSYAWKEGH